MIFALLGSMAIAGSPDAVRGVVFAEPFVVDQAFVYGFTAEHPEISAGTVIVVDVDPATAFPRDARMPVLYVGTTPVEWINTGYPDGKIVGFVPGTVDWATSPVFFGSTELPERIDAARGRQELDAALAAGYRPQPVAAVTAVSHPTLHVVDEAELRAKCADLIDQFAPSEHERAVLLRGDVVARPGGAPP